MLGVDLASICCDATTYVWVEGDIIRGTYNIMNEHYWEVGDVFVDNERKSYIIYQINSQTNFEVLDLYDQETHGWWVENDTHYVGHINPKPQEDEVVITRDLGRHGFTISISEGDSIENSIAADLAKLK